MLRKLATQIIVGLILIQSAGPVLAEDATKRDPSRPNIVFIMADDLGWADVAMHGGSAPTPHLDRLAREGIELTQHYVAPVCSPTRTGLLTGRFWSRFGVTSPQNERALPWDTVTLPRALQSLGYATCLSGKWHLGSKPEWGPLHYGFDHAYGSLAGGEGPWNHRYKQGPFTQTWHRNEKLLEETGHATDLLAAEAVSWLKQHGQKPFFLYVPFTAVHLPIKEPEEYLARVPAGIQGDVPRQYAACVMHLDDAVGRILGAIEEGGKRDNTIVVFTSDNGGSTAENNDTKYPLDMYPSGKLTGNNAPLRGQKGQLHEGGIRVPAFVRWPARLKAGKRDAAVSITDWMPTFCALTGYQSSADLKWDGTSIASLLESSAPLPQRPLYWVAPGWRSRAVRVGDWKLIVTGEGDSAKTELFDLATDPREATNLSAQQPAKLSEMLTALARVSARDRDAVARE